MVTRHPAAKGLRFTFVGLCAASVPLAASAQAANDTTGRSSGQLQEVVVTATKHTEQLLKAPVAVTALSGDQLQSAGVSELKDLTSAAPDVEMKTVGLANSVQVTIRGITNSDFNETGNPAVATYIDGVYVGRTEGLNGMLNDIKDIEVLRGPQDTLYGRNSTGGNINVTTADPEPYFGASSSVEYGNYNDLQVTGMVNLPLGDTLATRVAFVEHRNDGYYNTQGTTARNYGAADEYGARLTTLWRPGTAFSWRFAVDGFVSNGTPGLDFSTGPQGTPNDGLPIFSRAVPTQPEPSDYFSDLMLRSRMDWQIVRDLSLDYTAGYQYTKSRVQFAISNDSFTGLRPDNTENYSHEVDLHYESSNLQNILGATYFNQTVKSEDAYGLIAAGTTFAIDSPGITVPDESWGAFDQLTVRLAPSLRVIGGVRYSSERQAEDALMESFCPLPQYFSVPLASLPTFFGPGCSTLTQGLSKGSWSNVSWKAGLAFDISESTSGYATVTTGFKSGGVNPGIGNPETFKPEQVTNYELGLKTRLLDDRLGLNSAIFYENYRDLQVEQIAGGAHPTTVTENAAKARIYGVELEGQWALTDRDHLSGFVNYLSATYQAYYDAVNSLNNVVYPNLSGNSLPNSPRFSGRLQYSHDFDLTNGSTLRPLVAVYVQSKTYLTEFNMPIDLVGGYAKLNANVTYIDSAGHWEVSAFGDNLTNRAVRNNGYVAVGQYLSDYDPPRTYGVRVSYRH